MRWGVLSALAALLIIAQPVRAEAGRLAFDAGGEIYTMRTDGSERQRLTRTPGERESVQPAWSPDGSRIAFARGSEKLAIWVRESDGSERRLTRMHGPVVDFWPAWRPDG